MQKINVWLFPLQTDSEQEVYKFAELEFDEDYDRENPITQAIAILEWYNRRINAHKQ